MTLALATNPGGATLGGTLTVNGQRRRGDVHRPDARQGRRPATRCRRPAPALSSATTNAITVAAATATQLVVTTQPPASVTAGSGFGLVVTAEDAFGNVAPSFTGSVTLALATNPGGATLGGTVTVTASAGVATFAGLTLNKAGTGYTLRAPAAPA